MSSTRIAAVLATGLVSSLSALMIAAPRTPIPVTVTIADIASDTPLRIQSDRKGAYVTKSAGKANQVEAVILPMATGSDWSLTTYYPSKNSYAASDRTVWFDLRELVAPGGVVTPFLGKDQFGVPVEYGQVTAHLIGKCSLVNVDLLRMSTGGSAVCPGTFRFRAPDGLWYRLSFQPENFSNVDRMKVACTANDASGCKVWAVSAGGSAITETDPNPKSLNKLVQIDEAGNVLAVGGDYYLSFSITITR